MTRNKVLSAIQRKDPKLLENSLAEFDKVLKTDKQKKDEEELLQVAQKRLENLKAKDGTYLEIDCNGN